MNNKTEIYTIITGASRGLGKCLAKECAKKGRNLILISLAKESIAQTAHELSEKYQIKSAIFETDLTNEKELLSLVKQIKSNYRIDMLINNAGVGGTDRFTEAKPQYINNIIRLNMNALVVLSHQLLPLLKAENKAYILNIASLAAFGPMPYKTIYPASKAFVASFSRGLNAELKESNVSVSVAYPGGMATNPEVSKRMEQYSSLVKKTFLSPEKVAEICIKQTLAQKTVIVPGSINKLSRLLFKFVPEDIRLNMFSKNLQKELAIKTA